MSTIAAQDKGLREYTDNRDAVCGMLGNRFAGRFDPDQRLELYHEAWAYALKTRNRGDEISSLRNYLLESAYREGLQAIKRAAASAPVAPDSDELVNLADEGYSTEERVLILDRARVARELIDSLDGPQRELFKLRWDLQLEPSEIRRTLALSARQYKRLAKEGAERITEKVNELHDGTWSRHQRSLLTACLVGIATGEQRAEAQRRLDSDPHVRALFADVDRVVGRAAEIMPLPALAGERSGAFGRVVEGAAAFKGQLADLTAAGKQQATALSLRASDATPLAGARPGAATAAIVGCLAVGGGTYCAVEGIPDSLRSPLGLELQEHRDKPSPPQAEAPPVPTPEPVVPPTPLAPAPEPVAQTPAAPTADPAPTPPPAPPLAPAEESFGIEQGAGGGSAPAAPAPAPAPAPPSGGGGEFGIER